MAGVDAGGVGGWGRGARRGAEILAGGVRPARPGAYYEPTLIAGPDQKSEIVQDEVVGPVVTVQRFSDEEQAITWANDVRFGLAAGEGLFIDDRIENVRAGKAEGFPGDQFTGVASLRSRLAADGLLRL